MTIASLKRALASLSSGRARASWRWKAAAALGPPLVAFLLQWYILNASMARWALFYPAVFLASWLGGLSSGLAATAISSALVPMFMRAHFGLTNLVAAIIFVTMSIAVSIVHERLRGLLQRLEQSRQWLQAIMDYSPNVIVIKSFDGRYLMVNHQLEDMLQLAPGEAVGKTDADLFPHESAQLHHESDVEVFAKRGAITYEEAIQLENGGRVFQSSKFPLNDSEGHPFAICAIWSDITERKHIEEALRQSESDLRQAERVAHLGSWTWNNADDSTRWSEELYRITGLEPPPASAEPGLRPDPLFTPEALATIRGLLHQVVQDGQPHEAELEIVRPDGATRWIAVRGEAVRDETGSIEGVSGTAQDISELKELQRQRDEWTSLIAHELRQPIGVISMAASALPELHAASLTKKELSFVALITTAVSGLTRLVDDLLDLSLLDARRLTLDRSWIPASALVNETVERLAGVTTGHRVAVTMGQGRMEVCVDALRMGQVLGNLLSNAAKYCEPGSDIDIRTEVREAEVDIAVTNRGAGIQPEDLPHLFERFSRTDQARHSDKPGLGIGLYVANQLVLAHGGRLWVESTPGGTTTFHVGLPARPAAEGAAKADGPSPGAGYSSVARISNSA